MVMLGRGHLNPAATNCRFAARNIDMTVQRLWRFAGVLQASAPIVAKIGAKIGANCWLRKVLQCSESLS
jgi:hypothetical protein